MATLSSILSPTGIPTSAEMATKVTGPASSTDNTIARYDGATGKLLQGSGVVVDDSDNVTLAGRIRQTGGSDAGTTLCHWSDGTTGYAASYALTWRTGPNNSRVDRMTLTVSGNLLVGGDNEAVLAGVSPALALGSSTGTTSGYAVTNNAGTWLTYLAASSGTLNWYRGGIDRMSLDSSGNLHVPGGGAQASNEAFGKGALAANTTGVGHVAVGVDALRLNTTGSYNTAVGSSALYYNTTGNYNTGVGYAALREVTEATGNTAVGYAAGLLTTTGSNNTTMGYASLYYNTTGTSNCAYGYLALYANTTGYSNIAQGHGALQNNSTGYGNVGVGTSALVNNTTGAGGTAVGFYALQQCTGNNNTAIGYYGGYNITTGSGNVSVGGITSGGSWLPAYAITTQSNYISMGSTSATNAYIQCSWTVVSDARDKTDFAPVPHGLEFVSKLSTTAYRYKESRDSESGHGPLRYGFKAQDILALEGENPVIIDAEDPEKLRFTEQSLIAVMVNAIKELNAKVDSLSAELATLKGL